MHRYIAVGVTHLVHDSIMALNANSQLYFFDGFFLVGYYVNHLLYLVRRTVGNEVTSEPVTIKCELDEHNVIFHDDVDDLAETMTLGLHSMTNNTFGNNAESLDCVVCGDRATGKKK